MECRKAQDLLPARLDGDLSENELRGLEDHLGQCRRCEAEERALRETLSLLRGLPPAKAPPEFLDGVRRRIETERPKAPLWRKLFLPAHIKVPLEAAAALLLFLLVYGVQKGMPPSAGDPEKPPTAVESNTAREHVVPQPEKKSGTAREPAAGEGRAKRREPPRVVAVESPPREVERNPPVEAPEKPGAPAKASLPAVPATRVSTEARPIESPFPRLRQEEDLVFTRVFSAPPSRLLRPAPYGREVTVDVSPGARAGLEERIAAAAERVGGTAKPVALRIAAGGSREAQPERGSLRVQLPAAAADEFLDELKKLGTIPPEGLPAEIDIPAGPAPGIVVYTVRIRVR